MPSWKHPRWSKKDQFNCKLSEWGTAMLRLLPPETAHDLGMSMLEQGFFDKFLSQSLSYAVTGTQVQVPGIGDLRHPIGLAAGFDKDCRAIKSLSKMGFSFLEIGTITPLPQAGNPKPRLFRYPEQRALVNRMGFNSQGASNVSTRLKQADLSEDFPPVGVNLGKNKLTPEEQAADDYINGFEAFRGLGAYYVFNISSPNTPGLRSLASEDFLNELGERLGQQKHKVWLKLDPDMGKQRMQKLIEKMMEIGFQGVILSNTHKVDWPEKGGMSGHPLSLQAGTCLEWAYEVHKGDLPMVASGGILSGGDVFDRLARGANAVQIYTALVYRGPWVVAQLLVELLAEMNARGFEVVSDVIGSHYNS